MYKNKKKKALIFFNFPFTLTIRLTLIGTDKLNYFEKLDAKTLIPVNSSYDSNMLYWPDFN